MTDLPVQHDPEETVDGVAVVPADVRALDPVGRQLPAVRAAAVAATGFAAGVVTVVALRRRHVRKPAASARSRARKRKGSDGELLSVLSTRSFLLDVHLLGRE